MKECEMADATPVEKAGSATKAAQTKEPVAPEDNIKDGEFVGELRYEGTILVDRKVGDDWVSVMTDKPRPGDRVQKHDLNEETGELEVSQKKETAPSTMPRKS